MKEQNRENDEIDSDDEKKHENLMNELNVEINLNNRNISNQIINKNSFEIKNKNILKKERFKSFMNSMGKIEEENINNNNSNHLSLDDRNKNLSSPNLKKKEAKHIEMKEININDEIQEKQDE